MKAEIRLVDFNVDTCLEVLKCLIESNTAATVMVQEKSVVKDNITDFADISSLVSLTFSNAESINMIPDGAVPEKTEKEKHIKTDEVSTRTIGSHREQYEILKELFSEKVTLLKENAKDSDQYVEMFAQTILCLNERKDRCYKNVVEVLKKLMYSEVEYNTTCINKICGENNYRNFSYALRSHFIKRNEKLKERNVTAISPIVLIEFFKRTYGAIV